MRRYITTGFTLMMLMCLLPGTTLFAGQVKILTQAAPDFNGQTWLNSPPLTLDGVKGKVVMVEFWTYGCYNCVNVEPYVKQWYQRYKSQGLEVIAVHSPEFSHERKIDNVRAYVKRKGIPYPVVLDNDFAIWRRYDNHYWPALYLIDKQGQLRYQTIGEGRYRQTEEMVQALLAE